MRGLVKIALALACAVPACTNDSDKPARTAQRDDTRADRDRDRAVRELEGELSTIDSKLTKLKDDAAVHARELSAEGKTVLGEAIEKLEEMRASVRRELDDARRGSGDWGAAKTRVDDGLRRLRRAADEAVEKLKSYRVEIPKS